MADRIEDIRMTIGEHIEELRKRVLYALYAFGAVFFVTFLFHKEVQEFAVKPYQGAVRHANQVFAKRRAENPDAKLPKNRMVLFGGPSIFQVTKDSQGNETTRVAVVPWLVYGVVAEEKTLEIDERPQVLSPQEGVFQAIKLSMLMALLVSAPMLIYQLWAFVRSGLYANERDAIAPYLPLGILLFVAGAAFGYFYMVPLVLNALLTWQTPEEVVISTRLQEYLSLFYTFTFSLGFIFEIPAVMMMCARIGMVSARGFLAGWRYAVLCGVIVGAVINPAPDILTQLMFAAPIVGLYFVGVGLAFWAEASRRSAVAHP
jgi:sec-independent protein translocase protein TatC